MASVLPVTDVEVLFQTHTIDEIKDIEKSIRGEIEKKKEELRVMVGERYRDLINAADTISEMKTATCEVFSAIDAIGKLCAEFGQVKGNAIKKLNVNHNNEAKEKAFYSLAIQMELLVDTPEKIWSALDLHQYLTAAQLYLLAQYIVNNSLHINTGDANKRKLQRDVFASFPILHHQWAAISHFRPSILKGARDSIKDSTLPDRALAESLCSIALLDDLSPKQVFSEFLLARKAAVTDVFYRSMQGASVKKQICDVAHLIHLSVFQIVTLFSENREKDVLPNDAGKSAFLDLLSSITDASKASRNQALQFILGDDIDVLSVSRHLPQDVLAFTPRQRSVLAPLSESYIQKHSSEWLDSCLRDVQQGVEQLLPFVTNLKGLALIRDAVYEILTESASSAHGAVETGKETAVQDWASCCRVCFSRDVSVWGEFFQPWFTHRAKAIVKKHLSSAFSSLVESTDVAVKDLGRTCNSVDDTYWDHDMSGYLWHESPNELPSAADGKECDSMLSLQVKACTPTIKRLCNQLDSGLLLVLNDVRVYVGEESTTGDQEEQRLMLIKKDVQKLLYDADVLEDVREPFDRYVDASIVVEYLGQALADELSDFCRHVSMLAAGLEKELQALDSRVEPYCASAMVDRAAFLGRFCMCMADVCPSIGVMLDVHGDQRSINRGNSQLSRKVSRGRTRHRQVSGEDKFEVVEKKLLEVGRESFRVWSRWVVRSCSDAIEKTVNCLRDLTLFSAANWENVIIEEEGESGRKLKSSVRVPSQLSFYLSSLVFRLAEETHRVGSHVLERCVVSGLAFDVGRVILTSLEQLVASSFTSLCQNQALQMMFDVAFVSSVLGGSAENKSEESIELRKRAIALRSKLEQLVDPFDLDVISPHLQAFVERHIQRSWLILGTISNLDRHSVHSSAVRAMPSSQEAHSVVQMAPNPARFMQLPISSQHSLDPPLPSSRSKVQLSTDFAVSPLFLHRIYLDIDGVV